MQGATACKLPLSLRLLPATTACWAARRQRTCAHFPDHHAEGAAGSQGRAAHLGAACTCARVGGAPWCCAATSPRLALRLHASLCLASLPQGPTPPENFPTTQAARAAEQRFGIHAACIDTCPGLAPQSPWLRLRGTAQGPRSTALTTRRRPGCTGCPAAAPGPALIEHGTAQHIVAALCACDSILHSARSCC